MADDDKKHEGVAVPRTKSSDLPGANRNATLFDLHALDKRVTGRLDAFEANQKQVVTKVGEIEKHTLVQNTQLGILVKAEEKREARELREFDKHTRLSTEREKTLRIQTSSRAKIIIAIFSFLSAAAGAAGAYFAIKG